MSNGLLLSGLPIPPSENAAYATNFRTKRRFRTNDLSRFQMLMLSYRQANLQKCKLFESTISEWIQANRELMITCVYYLHPTRVYTKDGRLKKKDVSNLNKAMHDSIGDILGFDDRHIKVMTSIREVHENESASVIIEGYSRDAMPLLIS